MGIIRFLFIAALACAGASGCVTLSPEDAGAELQRRLQSRMGGQLNVMNGSMLVDCGAKGFSWAGAAGMADPKLGVPMTADTPFHAASVGKIFTAASIARLVDQGGMSFDDPVSKHLPRDIMDGLHVYGGMDYSGDILIRHLLAHTSGLPDFFFDVPESGGSFIQTAKKDPTRVWTPEDTVRFAVEKLKPFFPPGRDFHYTDTEYNLLGLIIERVSGLSLAEVFSRDFFLPLGMSDSFLYTGSPRDSKIAHVLFGGWDVTGNVPMITASWGGGGAVSTLERMRTDTRVFEGVGGIDYGYGLMLLDPPRLSPFLSGFPRAWGHSGSTGAFLYYCPELDAVLAGTLDQQATEREHVMLVLEAIGVLMRLR